MLMAIIQRSVAIPRRVPASSCCSPPISALVAKSPYLARIALATASACFRSIPEAPSSRAAARVSNAAGMVPRFWQGDECSKNVPALPLGDWRRNWFTQPVALEILQGPLGGRRYGAVLSLLTRRPRDVPTHKARTRGADLRRDYHAVRCDRDQPQELGRGAQELRALRSSAKLPPRTTSSAPSANKMPLPRPRPDCGSPPCADSGPRHRRPFRCAPCPATKLPHPARRQGVRADMHRPAEIHLRRARAEGVDPLNGIDRLVRRQARAPDRRIGDRGRGGSPAPAAAA